MKKFIFFFILLAARQAIAQVQIPAQTFISGGGATFVVPTTTTVTSFGNIGQPMVFARSVITSNGGGVMVANDIMFTSSTVDSEAPAINTIAAFSLIKGSSASFSSSISDNYQESLNAKLYYKPIAGDASTWESIALDKAGSAFTKTISTDYYNNGYDDMGMEYYVEAKDATLTTRNPVTGSLYAYLNYPAALVPSGLLGFGTQKNYKMLSIPFELTSSNNGVSQLFDELTNLDNTNKDQYRLFRYNGSDYEEFPDNFTTLERGRGYFILIANSHTSTVLALGAQTSPSNNRKDDNTLYKMTLAPGWNLVGNPYTLPVNWDNVATYNDLPATLGTPKRYSSGSYGNVTQQEAFEGVFVKNTGGSNLDIYIPFLGQEAEGGKIAAPEKLISTDIGSNAWHLPIVVEQNGSSNTLGGIGMHPDASVGLDRYDDFNPPPMADRLEINFKHEQPDVSRDVVTTASEFVWRFKTDIDLLETSTLQWDNSNLGNSDKELYLYDISTHAIVNMYEESHYSFSPEQSKEFKLYYGTDVRERIGPDEIMVDEPYPNPFSLKESLKFVVGLPDNLTSSYPVELIIRNNMGQPVYRSSQKLTPGLHTLTWSGRKLDNDAASAGFYYYTVQAGSQSYSGKVLLTTQND